jgi:N-acetylneuraminic acid mutarotase
MLLFGGINGGRTLDFGLRYDPLEDRWREMSSAGAPSARGYPAVAWTGDRLAVFGGSEHVYRRRPAAGGALYDPSKDRWQAIAAEGAPGPRDGHVLAWTGERLLVFGGTGADQDEDRGWFDDGAQYDVELGRWEPLPRAPLALIRPMGAWTSHGLVLVGQATPADERFTVMVLAARDEE